MVLVLMEIVITRKKNYEGNKEPNKVRSLYT